MKSTRVVIELFAPEPILPVSRCLQFLENQE
jgi:hypothetical protein